MLTKDNKIKCDACGIFISYEDIVTRKAVHKHKLNTFGEEYFESYCKKEQCPAHSA